MSSERVWSRPALEVELAHFSLAAANQMSSPGKKTSSANFKAVCHDAAQALLELAEPADKAFVLERLEHICRSYPHCDSEAFTRLRRRAYELGVGSRDVQASNAQAAGRSEATSVASSS